MKSIKHPVAVWRARGQIARGQFKDRNGFDLCTRSDPIEYADQPDVIKAAPIFRG
jgi:hypothetical protein